MLHQIIHLNQKIWCHWPLQPFTPCRSWQILSFVLMCYKLNCNHVILSNSCIPIWFWVLFCNPLCFKVSDDDGDENYDKSSFVVKRFFGGSFTVNGNSFSSEREIPQLEQQVIMRWLLHVSETPILFMLCQTYQTDMCDYWNRFMDLKMLTRTFCQVSHDFHH